MHFMCYLFIACIRSKNKPILRCSYYIPAALLLYVGSLRSLSSVSTCMGSSRLHFLCALPNFIWWKYVWFDLKKKQKELTPHCQPWGWEMVYEVKVLVTQAWWSEFEPHDTPKKLGAVVYVCNPSTSTGRWEAEPGELSWRASLQIIQPDNARCQLKPHLCHEMRLKERMESWKAVIWSLYACHMIFMCSDTCVPPNIPNELIKNCE